MQAVEKLFGSNFRVSVLVGRNGAGKSRLLRKAMVRRSDFNDGSPALLRHIPAERGGTLSPDFETSADFHRGYVHGTEYAREGHQEKFRHRAFEELLAAERVILRSAVAGQELFNLHGAPVDLFKVISGFLEFIEVAPSERLAGTFRIVDRLSGDEIEAKGISSGEAEVISLVSSIFHFALAVYVDNQEGVLLLDEPDANLHPSLQRLLANLIIGLVEAVAGLSVVIATHSVVLLQALSLSPNVGITFVERDSQVFDWAASMPRLQFEPLNRVGSLVLSTFSGHALGRSLRESPLLIVEGPDDCRVWAEVSRRVKGQGVFPVDAGGVSRMNEVEQLASSLLQTIQADLIGYSLRDGDGKEGELEPVGQLKRFRTNCLEVENLMVTDQVLSGFEYNGVTARQRIEEWAEKNPTHEKADLMLQLIKDWQRREQFKLKGLEGILASLLFNGKPWEVAIGMSVGRMTRSDWDEASDHSIRTYLGESATQAIVPHLFVE